MMVDLACRWYESGYELNYRCCCFLTWNLVTVHILWSLFRLCHYTVGISSKWHNGLSRRELLVESSNFAIESIYSGWVWLHNDFIFVYLILELFLESWDDFSSGFLWPRSEYSSANTNHMILKRVSIVVSLPFRVISCCYLKI